MKNFKNEYIQQCELENVSLKETLSQKETFERFNLFEFEYLGNQKNKIRKQEGFDFIEETEQQNQINIIGLNDKQSEQEIEEKKYNYEQDETLKRNNKNKKNEIQMYFDNIDHQTYTTQKQIQKQNNVQKDTLQQSTQQIIQTSTLFKNKYSKVDLSYEKELQSLVITKQNLLNQDLFENECEKLQLLAGNNVTLDIIKIDKSAKKFTQIAGITDLYLSKYKIEDKSLYDHYFLILIDKLNTMHEIGIAHSDIKPQNIVLSYENQPYFIDFDASVLLKDYHQYFEFFTPSYNLDVYLGKKKSGLKFESSEEIKLCDKTQLALSFLFLFCEDDYQLNLFKTKDFNELLLIQSKNIYSNNREFVIQIISRILNQADLNIKITGTQNQQTFLIDYQQIQQEFEKLDDIQFDPFNKKFRLKRIDKFSLKLFEILHKLNYFIDICPQSTKIIADPEMEEYRNILQKHKIDEYYQQLINFKQLDGEDVFNLCQYLKTIQNKEINITLNSYNDYQIIDKHIRSLNHSNSFQINFKIHEYSFNRFFGDDGLKINLDINESRIKIAYEFLKSELLKYSFQIGFIDENLLYEIQFDAINKSIEKENELNNIKNNLSILSNLFIFHENQSKLINYLKIFKHVYKIQNLNIYLDLQSTIFSNINDDISAIMNHISTMEQEQTLFFQQGSKIEFLKSDIVQLLKYQNIELDKDSQKYCLKSLINAIQKLHDQLDKCEYSAKEIVLEKGEKLYFQSLEIIKMLQQSRNAQKMRFTFSDLMFNKQMWIEIENMIESKENQYIEIIFIDCFFHQIFLEILKDQKQKFYSMTIEFYTNQNSTIFYNFGVLFNKQKYNETRLRIIFITNQYRENEQSIEKSNKNGYCKEVNTMFKKKYKFYKVCELSTLKECRIEQKNKIAKDVKEIDDIKFILKDINNHVHYKHIYIDLFHQECIFSFYKSNNDSNFEIRMEYDTDLTESIVLELLNELIFSILTNIIISNKYQLRIQQKKSFLSHIIKQKFFKDICDKQYFLYENIFDYFVVEQFITDFTEFQHKYSFTNQKLTRYIIQNKDFSVLIKPRGLNDDQFKTFFNLIHNLIPSKTIEYYLYYFDLSISSLYNIYQTIICQKNERKNILFDIDQHNIFYEEFEQFIKKIIKDTQNEFYFSIRFWQLDFLQYMKIKFKDILRIKQSHVGFNLFCGPLEQNQKYKNKHQIFLSFYKDNFKNIKYIKEIVQNDSIQIKKNDFLNKKQYQRNSNKMILVNSDINNDQKKKKKIEREKIEVVQKNRQTFQNSDQISLDFEKRKNENKENEYLQILEDLLEIKITDQLKDGNTIHLTEQGYTLINKKIQSIKEFANKIISKSKKDKGQYLDFDDMRIQLNQNNTSDHIQDIQNTDINLYQIYYKIDKCKDINAK